VQVNAAIGLAGDTAAHHVADRHRGMALALHLAHGRQGVNRFATLGERKEQSLVVERWVAITKLASVFHFDGNSRDGLDHVLTH
jgi:hypothetical protein